MTSAERLCLVAARSEGLLVDFVLMFLLRWGLKLLGVPYMYFEPVIPDVQPPLTLHDFSYPGSALFYGSMYFASGLPAILFASMWCLYSIIALSIWGRTIGMRQAGLMLVDRKGRKPSVGRVILRQLLRPVSAIALLGYVPVGFTAHGEALHDLLAGTKVVYVPKETVATS